MTTSSEELKEQFQNTLMSIYHEKDLEKMKQMYSDDCSYTDLGLINTINMNHSQVVEFIKANWEGIEDIIVEVKNVQMSGEDNKDIYMEYEFSAKYVKDIVYYPAKARGQRFRAPGMTFMQLDKDGKTKVVRSYVKYYFDDDYPKGFQQG